MTNFRALAEKNYGDNLTWFFTQWLNSTGAPNLRASTPYIGLGSSCTDPAKCKGFRIVGEITQDLDLFRMPIEIKVDTDGRSETQRIDVVGTDSAFTIETFGRPRKISVDPSNWVLKNSPDIKLRAAIQRGQGLVQQNDLAGRSAGIPESARRQQEQFSGALSRRRSLLPAEELSGCGERVSRIAERRWRSTWTEVWSHLQLGKIFDITGQRERASNEYRQAIQTQDNTQGALEEARKTCRRRTIRSLSATAATAIRSDRFCVQTSGRSTVAAFSFSRSRTHHQHVKRFAHAFRRNQVLELQRTLRLLLR